jgi:ubiquinone/menaquinone biosynthesis C-methylase UbiE
MAKHVCPWWFAYTFDNPLRRLFHKPELIFKPYLKDGMTAIDIGCGLGYFSIGMAKIVGEKGKITAVDIQQKMLDILRQRAIKAGVSPLITTVLCDEENLGTSENVDFALSFWMAHETPDAFHLFKQVHGLLKKSGKILLAEPKMHVATSEFKKTLSSAHEAGFKTSDSPPIFFSHTALLEKK